MKRIDQSAPSKSKPIPLYLKIPIRILVATMLIFYVVCIKMPLAILAVLMAALVELLDILLGFILRKKMQIDYKWPKLKYEWHNTEKFLKSAIVDFLSD